MSLLHSCKIWITSDCPICLYRILLGQAHWRVYERVHAKASQLGSS